ncbi:uncharacterized protein [Ptychodera flava]|uniref:uncharacterized protein n=1 Tax=Ptychodera flava TaxID=63121 RepID=UPI00396A81E7
MADFDVCSTFCLIVLAVTFLWTFIGRRWELKTLALAMFFPGLTAITFEIGNIHDFIRHVLGLGSHHGKVYTHDIKQVFSIITMSLASVGIVMVTLCLCALWNIVIGWGTVSKARRFITCFSSVHEHNKFPIVGFLRAAGEEIGWRCYLLPCLMSSYTTPIALAVSGLIWGLYHVPVMIVLSWRLNVRQPWLTVLIQCLSVAVLAFPHGWVSIRSGSAFWAPTVMHFTWNMLNPAVFGSIYTNTPGYIVGKQWLINGEGLAGIIVGVPIALLVAWDLS